jgi:chromosome segregation ATPase
MGKKLVQLLATGLFAGILLVTPVVAAEDGGSASGSNSGSGSSTSGSGSDSTKVTSGTTSGSGDTSGTDSTSDAKGLEDRLQKRKTEFKTNLTATQKLRLTQKCKPSQAVIKKLGDKTNANVPARAVAFTNLQTHLDALVTKLGSTSADLTELKSEQATLKTKLDTFNTDLAAYKTTLSDLQAVNCATDPTAFEASLAAARTARQKLATELTDIKSYVKDTIKPTLVKIRQQLAASKTGSESETEKSGSTSGTQTTTSGGSQ